MDESINDDRIVIQIAGKGTFKIPYHEGWDLRMYLRDARSLAYAIRKAVYDTNQPERGRLRLNHIPAPGAKIYIGSANWSPVAHLQRTNHDAERLARNMGGGAAVVEYQKTPTQKIKERISSNPVEDIESI